MAPFTCDVIHLIFTCCGADLMSDWNELLSDYYDYIKVPPSLSLDQVFSIIVIHLVGRWNMKEVIVSFFRAI